MSATIDATVTTGNSADGLNQQASGVTSITCTGINVGASATGICADGVWAVNVGSPTMTWNGVSMSAGPIINSGGAKTGWWFLGSPASGNKNLVLSWTTAADCYLGAFSVNGGDSALVIKAADNATATNTTTITVTSDANGLTAASFAVDGSTPTVNFTKLWAEAPLGPGGGASYTLGGASNAHTFTGAGGTVQALAGVHVIAGAAASDSVVGPFHIAGPGPGPEIRRMALPQRYPDTIPPSLGETTPLWTGPSISELPGVARRRLPQRYADTIIPPPSPGGPTLGRVARGPGGMGPARRRQIAQLFADTIIVLAALTGNVVLAGEVPSLTTTLQPTEGSIVISGNAPSITTILQATEGSVVIGGNAPSLSEQLQAVDGVVVIGGNVPAISQTGAGLNPTEAPLIIGGNAPALLFTFSPTEGGLSIDGNAPDLGPSAGAGPGGSSAVHRRVVYERPDKRKPPTFIDKIGEPVDLLAEALAPETVQEVVRAEIDATAVSAVMKARVPEPAPVEPLKISPAPDDDDEDDLLLLS